MKINSIKNILQFVSLVFFLADNWSLAAPTPFRDEVVLPAKTAVPKGYKVVEWDVLSSPKNYRVEILQDERIDPEADWIDLFGPAGPEAEPIKYAMAMLRLVDPHGRIIDSMKLTKEISKIECDISISSFNFYFISEDYSNWFGSFAGPATSLYTFSKKGINIVKYKDVKSGTLKRFTLGRAAYICWDVSDKNEIISKRQTHGDDDGTYTVRRRYYFKNKQWHFESQTIPGSWDESEPCLDESDGPKTTLKEADATAAEAEDPSNKKPTRRGFH